MTWSPINLGDYCYFFSLQVGVISLSCMGTTVFIITFFVNLVGDNFEADESIRFCHYFIVYGLCATGFISYALGLSSAYQLSSKVALAAGCVHLFHFVLWLVILILSFTENENTQRYLCINNRCADRLFVQDALWRPYPEFTENRTHGTGEISFRLRIFRYPNRTKEMTKEMDEDFDPESDDDFDRKSKVRSPRGIRAHSYTGEEVKRTYVEDTPKISYTTVGSGIEKWSTRIEKKSASIDGVFSEKMWNRLGTEKPTTTQEVKVVLGSDSTTNGIISRGVSSEIDSGRFNKRKKRAPESSTTSGSNEHSTSCSTHNDNHPSAATSNNTNESTTDGSDRRTTILYVYILPDPNTTMPTTTKPPQKALNVSRERKHELNKTQQFERMSDDVRRKHYVLSIVTSVFIAVFLFYVTLVYFSYWTEMKEQEPEGIIRAPSLMQK